MILEGSLDVIGALKEKKRLIEAGESHEHLKILCICNGGLMKGAYSVGVGYALEDLGFTNVFTDFVGVSSGAPSAAYFLGGNVHTGNSLIYDECVSEKFFKRKRFWNITDVEFLMSVLEGKTGKDLDMKKIFGSMTRLHIGVSRFVDAAPRLISPKTPAELMEAIKASVLMPAMTTARAFIDGERYMDGGFSAPHIIEEVIAKIECTHVLLLTSQNHENDTVPKSEYLLNNFIFRHRTTKKAREVINNRKESLKKGLDALKARTDIQSLLVWGDGTISGTETNPTKIKAVVDRYREDWTGLMTQN